MKSSPLFFLSILTLTSSVNFQINPTIQSIAESSCEVDIQSIEIENVYPNNTKVYTDVKPSHKKVHDIYYYNYKTHLLGSSEDSITKTVQPEDVLRNFFDALNQRNFKKAFDYCKGPRWGTLDFFASEKSYGGITAVKINSINTIDLSTSNTKIMAMTQVTDPTNGSGEFEQEFTLELQANKQWMITTIKLIASNRPQDNWNLKLTKQDWISYKDIETFTSRKYENIPNPSLTDNPADTMLRALQPLHFFKADNIEYSLAIVENNGPFYGASEGWCDLFLFRRTENGKWEFCDEMLETNGGGMYGNSGNFETMLRIGKHNAGIVLSGGQTHMGSFFYDDIIMVSNGKLTKLLTITTHHSYGNWEGNEGYKVCEDIHYKFLKNENEMYDLHLILSDCLTKKQLKKVSISFKDGNYIIPDSFVFSN